MGKIEQIQLISINILKTSLESIDNQVFIEEMQSSNTELKTSYIENKNHTYYEDRRFPFGRPEAEKLIIEITNAVNSALGKEMVMSEIWTLTLENGQSVSAHSHKLNTFVDQQEYYSIAYYPFAPEGSSDLIFSVNACNTLESSIHIKAETSSLVIFNSYLTHMTNRHNNMHENRIVVSANFHPKYPNVSPIQDWSGYSREEGRDSVV
jgi:hypothetical protein